MRARWLDSVGRYGRAAVAVALLCVLGCSGTIERGSRPSGAPGSDSVAGAADPTDRDAPGTVPAGTKPAAGGAAGDDGNPLVDDMAIDCAATEIDPGPAPLRLLSRAQYLNSVRDLLGDVPGLAAALGPASEASAFGLVQPDVSQVELESFQAGAELIAATVANDPVELEQVAPCAAGSAAEDCARAMVGRFGARAYRAALDDADDVERHLALFRAGAATSYAHGIELLLRGVLQAPRFLYRVEIGTGAAIGEHAVKLSGAELAARLSYMAWDSAPDDTLLAAADSGALDGDAGLQEQLARLLADPRGSSLLRRFLEGWVHSGELDRVVKNAAMFPAWQAPEFRAALRDQAGSFFDHVLGEEGGTLTALLTSRTVFASKRLGDDFGVAAGDAFEPLQRAAGEASGVLTLPALLARAAKPDESSPIYRGKFVREALLCQQLPSPPANVPKPPEVEPGVSTRERLRQHEVDPNCSGCHRLLDPIGFGFEHFDAIGRYRSEDGGDPVDVHGELVGTADSDGTFEGVSELGARLAQSSEVEQCMARQWFRYALSRFEQDEFDACSLQAMLAAFRAAGQDLNALPGALVATDAFRYRRPLTEGGGP